MMFAETARRAGTVCAIAVLAACGGSPTVPNSLLAAPNDATSSAHSSEGCPLKRCIIVGAYSGFSGKPPAAVLFFARGANGNASPAGEISGSKTMLQYPAGLAMDSHGNIYAANEYADSITVYAPGSRGNIAPVRTIAGAKTKLNAPAGIAIDSRDELYVANNKGHRITIYSPNANGDVLPIREIAGTKTGLLAPWGIALDSRSNLYVVANDQYYNASITVYAPNAAGNVTPLRTIAGSATELVGPAALTVDASGFIYVVDTGGVPDAAVAIFASDANGNEAPISYFVPEVQIYSFGIALDGRNNMYVTSLGYDDPPSVAVFAAGTTGNEGHVLRTIVGKKTKLIFPQGIIVR